MIFQSDTDKSKLENLEDLYELSPMQQGMLFHTIYAPDSGTYFEQSLFTIKGDLNVSAFEGAWRRVVDRHSILRTSFLWEDLASPVQVVHRQVNLKINKHDWRSLSADEREHKLQFHITEDRGRDFVLSTAPLMRLALFRVAEDEYKFLFSRHHLLLDRWSRALLLKDFFVIYDALSEGRQPSLEPPRPYGDYIAWLAQQDASAAEDFWRKSLRGFAGPTSFVVDRRIDHAIGAEREYADRRIQLSESATDNLRSFASQHRLTMNTLAQGAWALLLSRYSGAGDVVFGVTMAGRPAGLFGVESMVGLFINTLPLRVQVPPTDSVLIWLRDLQERQAALQQYEYSSLLDIHGWSDVPRSEPLFESIFVFENLPVGSSFQTGSEALEMRSDRGIGSITDYPLTVLVIPGSRLTLQMVFDRSRFEEATVDRMLGHLATLLASVVANPEQRLDGVLLLTESERRQILDEWNQTQIEYEKDRCIHELFEAQVERTPEATALVNEDERLTYLELNQRANQLAHYLKKSGVGPESLVGVFMERSVEMIVGLLAILKAGGAYVPLDPTYPQERLRFTVHDARLSAVLTQERLAGSLPASDANVVCLDREWQEITHEIAANPVNKATPRNLAYLIYTSGSTGKPKGVAIEHASVVAFLDWAQRIFSREELSGVLASTSICFDLSVFEMFVPLSCGGKVILAEDALQLPILKAKAEVKLINTVPSAMAELVRLGGLPDSLETVNLAGEPLRTSLVQQIYQQPGIRRVFDLYGPSEDTTYSTFALRLPDQPETIGRPISNTRVYILDRCLRPVPIGVGGELYLGGSGLVRGYFERPELTAESFIADPFSVEPGQRLYRTGDLARYASDGAITYLGRADHQVKIRGYRIELGEIEAVINQHSGVRETVLLAREDEPGDRRLVAYVVPGEKEAGIEPTVNEGFQAEQVSQWQAVWDETFREEVSSPDPTFNIIGWNSSYTGEPIAAKEMKEWVERTVERILSLGPGRVLEIGCGTGLLLFRIAPHSESYHGTDLSQKALDYLSQQIASSSGSYQNVTISGQQADDFTGIEPGVYDTVILNSVVQYFPSVDYLLRVLEGAAKAVKPGGSIFLGDLRSLRLLDAFHTSVQLYDARSTLATTELLQRAQKEASQEKELAIDSGLFAVLNNYLPQISRVEIQLKRGRARNELTKFRYDAILHIGNAPAPRVEGTWLQWQKDVTDLSALHRLLTDTRPEVLGITGLLNDRVAEDVRAWQLATSEDVPATVGELRAALKHLEVNGAVDPEDIWSLGAELGYEVELKWGVGSRDYCDLVLRRRDTSVVELAPLDQRREELKSNEKSWNRYANNPLQAEIARNLVPELRRMLVEKLPEHMMPSAFVLLDGLPLTPNGKIDRRALPAPGASRPDLEADYVVPRTPTEELLATIWSEVLKLKQIGVNDDFFELGGHSLLATQVISRVRERFLIELPLRYLFAFTTVAGLASAVDDFDKTDTEAPPVITRDADREAEDLLAPIDQLSDEEIEPLLAKTIAENAQSLMSRTLQNGKELTADEKRALFADLLREKAAKTRRVAASFAQQRLWFLDQLESGSGSYNVSRAARLKGRLNVPALHRTLNTLVARHESLHTNFGTDEGEPVQIISPAREMEIPLIELKGLGPEDRESEARRLAAIASKDPFNLAQDQLLRATLFQVDEQDHVLLLVMHHIISDGWSMGVLIREIGVLYEAFVNDQPSPLPPLPIQYSDFTLWQRQWLQGDLIEEQLGYWTKQLAGAPAVLDLPTDRPRPPMQTFNGAYSSRALPKRLGASLNLLSRREGVTLFMTLLAAFQTMLHRYTNQEDIVIGTPIANRTHRETEDLIGFFVNTLVMRSDLSGNPTFRELLGRVKEISLGAYTHQDLPFEKLVEELNPERSLSHSPLFQVMFALQNAPREAQELRELTITRVPLENGTSKFELTFFITETASELSGYLEYNTDLFDEITIARMLDHFEVLLEGIVADPNQRLAELPLLTEAERDQLLVEWNNNKTEYPGEKSIQQLFEEQVEQTPEAVAVIFNDEQLTYRELNERANQVARYLQRLGVGPEVMTAISLERSLEMVVGLLGILKAGGAYVPLDPDYPQERLSFMLEDTCAPVLLTQESLLQSLPKSDAQVVCLDRDREEISRESAENLIQSATAENLAYVIYTSGSTGQPKGVAMTERALANLLSWQLEYAGSFSAARTLQFASLSFDVSSQEIFSTWCSGGTLLLISDELRRDALSLLRFLDEQKVERIFLPFVYLQHLAEAVEHGGTLPAHLSELITAGEQLEITPQIAKFCGRLKDCALHNHYGPSESHVVTAYSLSRSVSDWPALPPIGRPIANTRIYILDRNLEPTPVGVPGQLCIGGASLSRGYLNRPELAAEKFLPDPFANEPGARLYLTGDLARYHDDGNIQFLCRIDNQVKIRGFRVELGEIETMLAAHPSLREAVVVAREDAKGDRKLLGYVVAASNTNEGLTRELRAYLKERLPDYMIPSAFVVLERLPLTPSGKVNRGALSALDQNEGLPAHQYAAPRTSLEEKLAEIWATVLRRERIGIDDNFFELGGHSLLATQLISRVRSAFKVELPLRYLFECPTIEELAASILEFQQKAEVHLPKAITRNIQRGAQELLARIDQLTDEQVESLLKETLAESTGN